MSDVGGDDSPCYEANCILTFAETVFPNHNVQCMISIPQIHLLKIKTDNMGYVFIIIVSYRVNIPRHVEHQFCVYTFRVIPLVKIVGEFSNSLHNSKRLSKNGFHYAVLYINLYIYLRRLSTPKN